MVKGKKKNIYISSRQIQIGNAPNIQGLFIYVRNIAMTVIFFVPLVKMIQIKYKKEEDEDTIM